MEWAGVSLVGAENRRDGERGESVRGLFSKVGQYIKSAAMHAGDGARIM